MNISESAMFTAGNIPWTKLDTLQYTARSGPGVVVVQQKAGPRIYAFGGYTVFSKEFRQRHPSAPVTDPPEQKTVYRRVWDAFQAYLPRWSYDSPDAKKVNLYPPVHVVEPDSCCFLDVENGPGEWTVLDAKMRSKRMAACAILLDHSSVVICGGFSDRHYCDDMFGCELFDLNTHTFSSFSNMIESRFAHAGVHYNGTIIVLGGRGVEIPAFDIVRKTTCEQFDPVVGKWKLIAPLQHARSHFGAAVIDNNIYAVGDVLDIEMYDGSTWASVAMLPTVHLNASAVCLGGKLVTFGRREDDVHTYDPLTGTWQVLCKMPFGVDQIIAVSF